MEYATGTSSVTRVCMDCLVLMLMSRIRSQGAQADIDGLDDLDVDDDSARQ